MNHKRIIIHAGPFKTGSSAIQYWLQENRNLLAKNGVFYPEHKLDKNNVSSGNLQTICDYKEKKLSVSRVKLEALLLDFHDSDAQILLLSSEYFFSCIEELLLLLPNAEFVVFVRNPIDLANSTYNQSVKRAGNIEQFNINIDTSINVLNKLLRINEPERINLEAYYDNKEGWDITLSLFKAIGLEEIHKKMAPLKGKVNLSYSFECLEFKRFFNRILDNEEQLKLDSILQSCNIGVRKYSLIEPSVFKIWKNKISEILSAIDSMYPDSNVSKVISNIDDSAPPYLSQNVIQQYIIDKIGKYVFVKDEVMFEFLRSKYLEHLNNDEFNIFTSKHHVNYSANDMLCRKIMSGVTNKTFSESVDLARELAHYFEEVEEVFIALSFIRTAKKLKPEGLVINESFARIEEKCIKKVSH